MQPDFRIQELVNSSCKASVTETANKALVSALLDSLVVLTDRLGTLPGT